MSFVEKHKRILTVSLIAIISRLIYAFSFHPVWWDSASYIGMAKFLFSAGQIGIFEYTRPIGWPFLLGMFWKIGFDPIILGRILTFVLSIAMILLTYKIAEKLFNKNTAFIAAIILSFTPTFFLFTYRLYNHIPATFFSLLAVFIYLNAKKKRAVIAAGILLAFAFQTRFPQGTFFIAFLLFLVWVFARQNRRSAVVDAFSMGGGFLIGLIPFFLFNFFTFGNPIFQIGPALKIIQDGGWVFFEPWWYYLLQIPKENIFYLFALIGIPVSLKQKNPLPVFLALTPLLYYTLLTHKEMRFAIMFFPFLAILAAHGFSVLGKYNKKHWLTGVFILLFAVSVYQTYAFYEKVEPNDESLVANDFYRFFRGKPTPKGEVLISMPQQALDLWTRPKMMYFPTYSSERVQELIDYVQENKEKISYILYDTGEGGTLCHPEDARCQKLDAELLDVLKEEYDIEYQREAYVEYYIFKSKNIE